MVPRNLFTGTAVYPSNMAPIGLKLWENAFQTIYNFRFVDAGKKKLLNFSDSETRFSSFSIDFGGARRLLTSKSDSLTNFASGTQIFRFV